MTPRRGWCNREWHTKRLSLPAARSLAAQRAPLVAADNLQRRRQRRQTTGTQTVVGAAGRTRDLSLPASLALATQRGSLVAAGMGSGSQLSHRLSMRGTFGPKGSLNGGQRGGRSPSRAHLFQLDKCLDKTALDKVIYQMQSSSAVASQNKMVGIGGSVAGPFAYNVDGFAAYLAQTKALATLLFWKDAEEYAGLFGVEERKQVAEKIYRRYVESGAEYEVNSITSEVRDRIKDELQDPGDDLFAELQSEAYSTMLFELFPRFYDVCKESGVANESQKSKITLVTTLQDLIMENSFEIHLFAEYCKEQYCEDQVIFLLEVGEYHLLFSPSDRLDQAKRIYKTYLDPKSEARIAFAQSEFEKVNFAFETAMSTGSDLPIALFDKLYDDAVNMLSMDVFPRYREAVLEGKTTESSRLDSASVMAGEPSIDMSQPSKKAVEAIIRTPVRLEHLRRAAVAQGVKESVDFCVECQAYVLLFSEADRKPRAARIWRSFLMSGADSPINIPHTMIKKVEPLVDGAAVDIFDDAYNEVLKIISDNLFSDYLRNLERDEKDAKETTVSASPRPTPTAAGSCCLLM